jgi:iron complex outermembrane receptor protein
VKPETLFSHEVGFKYGHGPLHMDLAAFYYNYDNLQFQNTEQFDTPAGLQNVPVLSSAGNAISYGAEFDIDYVFSEEFNVSLGAAWTHAHYTSWPNAVILYPCTAAIVTNPVVEAAKGCGSTGAGVPGKVDDGEYQNPIVNVSGDQMIRAPEYTLSFRPDYRKETSVGVFELSANLYASSRVYFQADDNPFFSTGPFMTLDLNGSWSPDGHYKIELWGTNVTDTKYLDTVSPDATSARLRYSAPTEFGATFSYKY